MANSPQRRSRSRTVRIVQRRLSLVPLIIALFVARIVVTVAEIVESRLTFWSALISLAIALEAYRAWRVARLARASGVHPDPLADTVWDRALRPAERVGPTVLYGLTAAFAVAYAALSIGSGHATAKLDLVLVGRTATTVLIIAALFAGYRSTRDGDGDGRS